MNAGQVPLLLLDRDGAIVVERGFPKDPDEIERITGSAAAALLPPRVPTGSP